MNMSWQLWVVLAIAGGLIGNAAWAALCGATRLVDRRIPHLALWIARVSARMLPPEQQGDPLYNFENDAHEALQGGHRYSALRTSLSVFTRNAAKYPVQRLRRYSEIEVLQIASATTATVVSFAVGKSVVVSFAFAFNLVTIVVASHVWRQKGASSSEP